VHQHGRDHFLRIADQPGDVFEPCDVDLGNEIMTRRCVSCDSAVAAWPAPMLATSLSASTAALSDHEHLPFRPQVHTLN
jgi:hypothetical protein